MNANYINLQNAQLQASLDAYLYVRKVTRNSDELSSLAYNTLMADATRNLYAALDAHAVATLESTECAILRSEIRHAAGL